MSNTASIPTGPIGVFDSGFGGLTILRSLAERLPQYSYMYLGDNARAPYGTRSFDTVYRFTQQAVDYLFGQGCPLVILACNTASAKALRTLQQRWLPNTADPTRRILGVIRPTAEHVATLSRNGHVGILATPGTVASGSYDIELRGQRADVAVSAHAAPMWVPLVEHGFADTEGADWFVRNDVQQLMAMDPQIDTVVLGCTHYPVLYNKIRAVLPEQVQLLAQGAIVADSLAQYLERHPEMERRLTKNGQLDFRTTDHPDRFDRLATLFMGAPVNATTVTLG